MNKPKAKTWRVIITIILCFFALCFLASGIFLVVCVTDKDYVEFDASKMNENRRKSIFLDKDGNEIDDDGGKTDGYIAISEIKDYTLNAFVSTEDKRFWKHGGLDLKRIGTAAFKNIFSGSYKEGASTITQQLVKNTFLTNEKKLKRKVNEMFLTLKVERNYNKKEILEMYLNTVYFGTNAYGIETAGKTYFGKSAANLTLAESAGLAGMLKAPNNYSPLYAMDKYLKRRNLVLDLMRSNGFIDDNQCESAKNEKVDTSLINTEAAIEKTYIGAVINEACALLGAREEQINKSCIIKTFYDRNLQTALKKSLDMELNTQSGACASRCGYVANNITGGVCAYLGYSNYNIFDIRRQVGSAIKPLAVYAPALDMKLITPATPVLDEKSDFAGYSPNNFNNKYYGWTTIRRAVADSMNVAAIKVLNSVGVKNALSYLNKNGIKTSEQDNSLAIGLGGFYRGVALKELLSGYLTLANEGEFKSVGFVDEISVAGKIVYKKNKDAGARVFRRESAYLMTDMLKTVTSTGTAKILSELNFEVAGKTGTAGNKNGNTDALFCGYDTQNTFLFWVGAESSDPLNSSVTGNISARIAGRFLTEAYREPPAPFQRPDGIEKIRLDKKLLEEKHSLALANNNIVEKETFTELFEVNNRPTLISERNLKKLKPKVTLSIEKDLPLIFVENLSEGQRLIKEFEGRETILKVKFDDGVSYAVDNFVDKNGIYSYFIKENDRIVSNVELYFKKVRSKEQPERKWFDDWFW